MNLVVLVKIASIFIIFHSYLLSGHIVAHLSCPKANSNGSSDSLARNLSSFARDLFASQLEINHFVFNQINFTFKTCYQLDLNQEGYYLNDLVYRDILHYNTSEIVVEDSNVYFVYEIGNKIKQICPLSQYFVLRIECDLNRVRGYYNVPSNQSSKCELTTHLKSKSGCRFENFNSYKLQKYLKKKSVNISFFNTFHKVLNVSSILLLLMVAISVVLYCKARYHRSSKKSAIDNVLLKMLDNKKEQPDETSKETKQDCTGQENKSATDSANSQVDIATKPTAETEKKTTLPTVTDTKPGSNAAVQAQKQAPVNTQSDQVTKPNTETEKKTTSTTVTDTKPGSNAAVQAQKQVPVNTQSDQVTKPNTETEKKTTLPTVTDTKPVSNATVQAEKQNPLNTEADKVIKSGTQTEKKPTLSAETDTKPVSSAAAQAQKQVPLNTQADKVIKSGTEVERKQGLPETTSTRPSSSVGHAEKEQPINTQANNVTKSTTEVEKRQTMSQATSTKSSLSVGDEEKQSPVNTQVDKKIETKSLNNDQTNPPQNEQEGNEGEAADSAQNKQETSVKPTTVENSSK